MDGEPLPITTSQRCSTFAMNFSLLKFCPKEEFRPLPLNSGSPAKTVVSFCSEGLLLVA